MKVKMSAKILLYDLETAPNIGYTWAKWDQNVIEFVHEWYILCFSYKWLGEKKTYVKALPDYTGYKKDKSNDKLLCADLWKLMDEADITIAHNGNSFDNKKAFARFIQHDMLPPSPFRSIDTLKLARRHFKFNCNKLDSLGQIFGVGRKVKHPGFSLWKGCMEGDEKSWNTMRRYAKGDVTLLEDVFEKLRPWADVGPNMALYEDDPLGKCPRCGSSELVRRGYTYATTRTYRQFNCKNCGHWPRSVMSEKTKKTNVR